jgi:hypothetical protein
VYVLDGKVADTYASFPAGVVASGLGDSWCAGAVRIYRNWRSLLAGSKGTLSDRSLKQELNV